MIFNYSLIITIYIIGGYEAVQQNTDKRNDIQKSNGFRSSQIPTARFGIEDQIGHCEETICKIGSES